MAAKILIVDDDLETLRLVGLMLQRQGFQIVAANNGTQALKVACKELPDLILLDVMMPDLDGFEVTRQLRKDPATSGISILMFTAKSQVDDKVTGYDAGVDDYLTKPIHPAELMARIKALLARSQARVSAAAFAPKGYMVGFIASKGGLGLSTTVLNVGISLSQRYKKDVLVVEMRPGQGSIALDLGFSSPDSLNNLLNLPPPEITPAAIEKELLRSTFGVRLLMASSHIQDASGLIKTEQMEMIARQLSGMAEIILMDIGVCCLPEVDKVLAYCDELFIAAEPYPSSIQRTRLLLDDVAQAGFGKSKLMNLVAINRLRADIQLSVSQINEMLGHPIAQMISPVPELAFQSVQRAIPLIQIQPDGLVAQQYLQLAGQITERIKK